MLQHGAKSAPVGYEHRQQVGIITDVECKSCARQAAQANRAFSLSLSQNEMSCIKK